MACSSALTLGLANAASGQATVAADAVAAQAEPSARIEEVVVYASKKSTGQLAQSLPASITAVTPQAIDRFQARDITDLQKYVPNVSLSGAGTFPGIPNLEIRGIAVNTSVRSVDPDINLVQDGMVIGYPAGAVLNVFDLESVEVLRGPQGVLFGRNASGGAVVLRTRLPGEKPRFIGDLSYGNFNEVQLRASIEGALAPKIRAKLALMYRHNDGYYQNTLDGVFTPAPFNPSGKPVPHATGGTATNDLIIKPTFVFDISDRFQFTLFTQYERLRDGGGYFNAFDPPGMTTKLQTLFGFTPPTRPYTWNVVNPGYFNVDEGHVIGQFDWRVGPGKLTAIAAYRRVRVVSTQNSDGTPFNLTIFPNNHEDNDQESLEVRYAGELPHHLSYVVGTFLYRSESNVLERRKLNGVLLGRPLGTFATQQVPWDQVAKSAAGFANVDWEIVPHLTLSAGVRYSWDDKSMNIIPLALCAGPGDFQGCATNVVSRDKSWTNVSPRAVVSWQVAPSHLLYFSYAQGYRPGNFNARGISAAAVGPDNPEINTSYEIGSKNEFFDHRLRLNVAGFYEDFSNIERNVVTVVNNQPVATLANAASATIKGFEADASAILFEGFRLDGNVGYTDAKYSRFVGLVGLAPGVDPTTLQFDRLPKWRYTVGGEYERGLWGGRIAADASYTWRSFAYTDVLNTPQLAQPAYGLLDASLSYRKGNIKYTLYGRNLTNQVYSVGKVLALNYFEFGGVPRTYGVQVGFDF